MSGASRADGIAKGCHEDLCRMAGWRGAAPQRMATVFTQKGQAAVARTGSKSAVDAASCPGSWLRNRKRSDRHEGLRDIRSGSPGRTGRRRLQAARHRLDHRVRRFLPSEGAQAEVAEGEPTKRQIVVAEFPSLQRAHEW